MTLDPKVQYPQPSNQLCYLGKVVSVFEDNVNDTDSEPRNSQIRFNILGLPEFIENQPIASLLGNPTRPVNVDDIVIIWDVCTIANGLHTFFYQPIFEDRFTGLKNYENYIDITERNYVEMKLPNTKIIFDKSNGNKQGQSEISDNSNGKITIESGSTNLSIDCVTGALDIKVNGPQGIPSTITINGNNLTGFNCIPVCPYAGATHITNTVITK